MRVPRWRVADQSAVALRLRRRHLDQRHLIIRMVDLWHVTSCGDQHITPTTVFAASLAVNVTPSRWSAAPAHGAMASAVPPRPHHEGRAGWGEPRSGGVTRSVRSSCGGAASTALSAMHARKRPAPSLKIAHNGAHTPAARPNHAHAAAAVASPSRPEPRCCCCYSRHDGDGRAQTHKQRLAHPCTVHWLLARCVLPSVVVEVALLPGLHADLAAVVRQARQQARQRRESSAAEQGVREWRVVAGRARHAAQRTSQQRRPGEGTHNMMQAKRPAWYTMR